mmetsp:Transcript_4080/g.8383  ORF Transcript_4080/g.8383 Transcript_4080/m.8383 type:complete len:260 (+) Transcript_4080:564-1343(+)
MRLHRKGRGGRGGGRVPPAAGGGRGEAAAQPVAKRLPHCRVPQRGVRRRPAHHAALSRGGQGADGGGSAGARAGRVPAAAPGGVRDVPAGGGAARGGGGQAARRAHLHGPLLLRARAQPPRRPPRHPPAGGPGVLQRGRGGGAGERGGGGGPGLRAHPGGGGGGPGGGARGGAAQPCGLPRRHRLPRQAGLHHLRRPGDVDPEGAGESGEVPGHHRGGGPLHGGLPQRLPRGAPPGGVRAPRLLHGRSGGASDRSGAAA